MSSRVAFAVCCLLAASVVVKCQDEPEETPGCGFKDHPESSPKDCCDMPRGYELWKECVVAAKQADPQACTSDCVFLGRNVLSADNEIMRDEVIDFLKEKFADFDPAFEELHESNVDHCIERVEKLDNPMEGECSRKPLKMGHCLLRQYTRTCPTSAWTESDTCTEWKEFIEKCPNAKFHGPHGPHGPPHGPHGLHGPPGPK